MTYRTSICLVIATLMAALPAMAADEESIEASDVQAPRCELLGLIGHSARGMVQ